MDCFKIKNLSFSYPNGNRVLNDVSLSFEQGKLHFLCGKSGCGKTTLLRLLVPALNPVGKAEGEVFFFGKSLSSISRRESVRNISFISQNTEYRIVTHTVRSELAFSLENLGLSSDEIGLRIAECAMYFSLSDIMDKKICELSGGQKQLVCLASALAVHPKVLVLDEPAAELDIVAARELFTVLRRLCDEISLTVIIAEHRPENLLPICDSVTAIDGGRVVCSHSPSKAADEMYAKGGFLSLCLPSPTRIDKQLSLGGETSLTVEQAGTKLRKLLGWGEIERIESEEKERSKTTALSVKGLYHSYGDRFVLRDFNLDVEQGTFLSLMGENAAGKTTALSLMGGILQPKRGRISVFGKDIKKYKGGELYNGLIAVLPQDVKNLFAGPTVLEDLENVAGKADGYKERLKEVCRFCEIEELLSSHPYDISGGELQRAALAMALLKNPKLLMMDEPTKGMDAEFKIKFGKKIKDLCNTGMTVIMVSHDAEFCAEFCDECALVFDGKAIVKKDRKSFFSENYFYTTGANKIAREFFPNAVSESEVVSLCKKHLES